MFDNNDEEDDFLNMPVLPPVAQNDSPPPSPLMPTQDAQVASPAEASPMNPMVKDYISKKFNLADYSPTARQELVEQSKPGVQDRIMAGLAAAGAGFMGQNAAAAGMNHLEAKRKEGRQKIEDFDTQRAFGREDEVHAREKDPNSQESQMANELAKRMGYKGAAVTAEQFKSFSPAMEKMYAIEQKRLDRQDSRDERRLLFGLKAQERKDKKEEMGTEGQRAVDKDYAKHYNNFTQKGAVNAKTAIDRLEALTAEMEKDTGIGEAGGGRIASVLPDVMRSRKAIERRDLARNFANTTLKELFGGQLSDAEREAAAKEYYNDSLDNTANAKILRDKIAQLKTGYATEVAKAKHYEKNGSLKRFQGITGDNPDRRIVKTQTNKKTGEKRIVYDDGSVETVPGVLAER